MDKEENYLTPNARRVLKYLQPTKTIADALRTYLNTAQLPPLPDADIADG